MEIKDIAAGYIRVSDADQSNFSIQNQQREIEVYCERNNLTLAKTFIDNGQSAFTFDRKEFKDLEAYIKKNKICKYLVVYALDRFSRANIADALTKMQEIQERLNVKILTVTDPVNIELDDMGVQLKRVVELLFSNFELQKIKKRTTDGIYQSRLEGRHTSTAPIGYKNSRDANDKPILIIDEEKAFYIRTIYRLFLQGVALVDIKSQIKNLGYVLKGNSALPYILSNPIYAGMIKVPSKKDKPSYLVKGLHQPIISPFDYWAVQPKLNMKKTGKLKEDEVFLRGVLACECGKLMTTGKSKGRSKYYTYYFCENHKKYFNSDKLHNQFFDVLNHISLSTETQKIMSDNIEKFIKSKSKTKGKEIMIARLDLQKVKDKISSVEEKYLLTPDMSESTYKKVMSDLKATESRLSEQVVTLSSTVDPYSSFKETLIPILGRVGVLFKDLDVLKKQEFIRAVFGGLSFDGKAFRTAFILPELAHNHLILKEKGLLSVDENNPNFGVTPKSAPDRT